MSYIILTLFLWKIVLFMRSVKIYSIQQIHVTQIFASFWSQFDNGIFRYFQASITTNLNWAWNQHWPGCNVFCGHTFVIYATSRPHYAIRRQMYSWTRRVKVREMAACCKYEVSFRKIACVVTYRGCQSY